MQLHLSLGKAKSFNPEALVKEWNLNMEISKKEQKGLAVISGHAGKRIVFESYLKTNPPMAMKYLKYISENPYARYVKWDAIHQRFIPAS